jgi:hypothetical protein
MTTTAVIAADDHPIPSAIPAQASPLASFFRVRLPPRRGSRSAWSMAHFGLSLGLGPSSTSNPGQ